MGCAVMVGPVENVTVAGDIRRLARTVEEVIDALRAQRELLRQRGMSLPPGSLGGLKEVYDSLQGLADQLTGDATELEQLRALAETTSLINSSLDINHVLNGVMDTVVALTRAERGYIVLRDEKTGQMGFRIARNFDRETIDEQELIVSRSIVEEVAQTGKDVQTTDALSDPNYSGRESVVFHGLRSILCVPLMVRDEVTGVVYVDNRIKNAFGEKQHQLLVDFANQAATAIENARLFGRVQTALSEITEMKELMDNVFASIASGVITTDVRDVVTAYNSAAERILEVPSQRALGQELESALPLIFTHIRNLFDDIYQHSEQKMVKLDPVLPGRGTVNLDLKLSPLRNEENIEGVAIVVDDLTEINRRDAKLNVIRRYLPPALVDNIQSLDELGLGGERRVISVVFVEARPFHTFPPDLRPQELMELLNLYLTVGAEAIHNQAGVVDKFMGNEIMGLFNTQLNPTEDHAWWAAQAALHMADDYVALAQQIGEDPIPYYRIAIHTGVATMGNVGSASRREFTAIGHTVNLAKRLQENATAGQIIISDETCRQCYAQLTDPASSILVQERPSIQMKGIRQMAQIFEIQRAPAEARSGER
jgi:adenylate cyclase